MRVLTADQSFGVIISAAAGALDPRFFVFQLIIGGQVVGDSDPSIIGSAMSQLSNLPALDHSKLSETRPDPASALELIGSDDACNPAMFNGASHWMHGQSQVSTERQATRCGSLSVMTMSGSNAAGPA